VLAGAVLHSTDLLGLTQPAAHRERGRRFPVALENLLPQPSIDLLLHGVCERGGDVVVRAGVDGALRAVTPGTEGRGWQHCSWRVGEQAFGRNVEDYLNTGYKMRDDSGAYNNDKRGCAAEAWPDRGLALTVQLAGDGGQNEAGRGGPEVGAAAPDERRRHQSYLRHDLCLRPIA
jgi:hypothetical protein